LIILNKLATKKRKFLDARVFVENLKKAMAVQKRLEYLKSLVGNAVESKVKMNWPLKKFFLNSIKKNHKTENTLWCDAFILYLLVET